MNPADHRLLLVEDNPGDARLFREMLRDLGYARSAVIHVETVEDALSALGDEEFHVLFLDLELPDASGLATLDTVLEAGRAVPPVIVLTGLSDEAIGTAAVQRGAQDYLVKGEFHADVLARVIRYARGRHEAVAVATRESARAAAAEARLATLQESREALEHEVAERRAAQAELERTLARLQAFRSIDRAIIANEALPPMLDVVLREGVAQLGADAATVLLCEDDTLVPTAQHRPSPECRSATPLSARDPAFRAALRDGAVSLDARDSAGPPFGRAEAMRACSLRGYHLLPLFSRDELIGALELFGREPFAHDPDWLAFADTLAGQAAVAVDRVRLRTSLVQANEDLVAAYDDTIDGWSRALDLRDRETEGHSRRVTELSLRLAEAFGFDEEELGHLRRGALLHDIGKMGVPDAILQKPGPLNEEEWAIMRRHPTLAYELLEPIEYLRPALDVPYAHHERWDGSGYPRGLQGEQIPLAARIFAVADVYDALTSDRPYRRAWDHDRAVRFTSEQAGVLFDPAVVEAFLRLRTASAAPAPSPSH